MALQRLFEAAEKAKIELSSGASTEINLPYITAVDGIPKHLVINLTRSKFDQLAEPIIDRTIAKAKSALEKSKLKVSDINEVLLVGGSSRIPLAQEKLEKLFGRKPSKALNPDTCVSTGATVQGSVLSGDNNEILLLDVLPITIGIETMGNVMTRLIEANTTIPTRKTESFSTSSDNQNSVDIKILQGERPMTKDNKSLGRFILDGIPPAPRGVPVIEITIDVDANGVLSVTAQDKATGKKNNIRIEGSTSLSKEEIERMKKDAEENAESDRQERESIEKVNQADSLIFQTEKQLKEFGDKLSEDNKTELNSALSNLKEAHKMRNLIDIDSSMNSLNEVWNKVSTEMYSKTDTTNDETVQDAACEEVKE